MFVRSIDASKFIKTGDKVYQLLNSFVEEIGEKKIMKLFWTPCVAHCLDLMLEDTGKIAKVKKVIQRGIKLVGYIYNHSMTLNTMRKFTNKFKLVRHGVTRFATNFLMLQRLHKQKAIVRKMFTSDEWVESRADKDLKGKKATNIVFMPSIWNDVAYALNAMCPIVRVLRLVDNEKKPAMGYIYEARDRAKEAIKKYKDIFAIIDKRWDDQLHHPLHAADYFLNPKFFYSNLNIEMDCEVLEGLYKCIDRFSENENDEFVDHIHNELPIYKSLRKRTTMAPVIILILMHMNCITTEWWKMYGTHTPHLKNIAIKVLSLTCSSSGCERNWSTFDHKRSRLENQKLQDLIYVKYNQVLHERYECRDLIYPIALKDIDDSNEWIVGELDGEANTRRQTQIQRIVVASTSNKERGKGVVEEDDKDELSQDEGEEEYNSSCNGSDEDNDMELEEDEEDY
ncbi:hypothetical protein CR513_32390, partial [Mucuna pruriens]